MTGSVDEVPERPEPDHEDAREGVTDLPGSRREARAAVDDERLPRDPRGERETRKRTAAATSSGDPRRPRGEAARAWAASSSNRGWSFTESVGTRPADTVLTRIPRGPSSQASDRTTASRAAFDGPMAPYSGTKREPPRLERPTSLPPSGIRSEAARARRRKRGR
jgi:hypothetical protein